MFDINMDELMASKRAQIEAGQEQQKNLESLLLLLNEELLAASKSLEPLGASLFVDSLQFDEKIPTMQASCSFLIVLSHPKWFMPYVGKASFGIRSKEGQFSCFKTPDLLRYGQKDTFGTAGDILESILVATKETFEADVKRLADKTAQMNVVNS